MKSALAAALLALAIVPAQAAENRCGWLVMRADSAACSGVNRAGSANTQLVPKT